jgi:hypothetical protein
MARQIRVTRAAATSNAMIGLAKRALPIPAARESMVVPME